MVFIFVGLAVLVGALAQRVSGMGFALVAAPVLVLLIGPFEGILLANLGGAVSTSIVISRVWRRVDWRQFRMLVIPALIAVVPGAFISVLLGGSALQIIVGVLLIIALTVSLFIHRANRVVPQRPAAVFSGAASGFLSATAGVGGPGMSVYAVLTRWEHGSFAATIQPIFVVLGVTSFITKVTVSQQSLPAYDWWVWPLVIACTLVGIAAGEALSRLISVRIARITVIVISYLGAVAAIVDGVLTAFA